MKWFISGGLVLILVGSLAWRFIYGDVFSRTVRAQLKPGMTTHEVAKILGPPASTVSGSWVYKRPLMCHWVIVYFDDSGRLTAAVDD
jgi:outer membrane protein assembly factor BamE (lipoprotein component of BamABCDE complex)